MPGLITNVGKNLMAYSLKSTRDWGYPTHMETGYGTTAPTVNDTNLEHPNNDKVTLTSVTVNTTNHTITFNASWTFTGTTNVSEIGLWAYSGGTYRLVSRETFSTITFSAGESMNYAITFTW